MGPRFVVVSSASAEGVGLVEPALSLFRSVLDLIPENLTHDNIVNATFDFVCNSRASAVCSDDFIKDKLGIDNDMLFHISSAFLPRGLALQLMGVSVAVLVAKLFYVHAKTRSIVKKHSHSD